LSITICFTSAKVMYEDVSVSYRRRLGYFLMTRCAEALSAAEDACFFADHGFVSCTRCVCLSEIVGRPQIVEPLRFSLKGISGWLDVTGNW